MLFAGVEGARQTTSDADGAYEFVGLPAGTYRINAGKVAALLAMADRERMVAVREKQVVAVNLVVLKPSAVTGAVLDEYGDPVDGVDVELLQAFRGRGPGGGRTLLERPPEVRPRRTDDRGQYRLFPVAPGEHYVAAGEVPQTIRGTSTGPETSLRVYYPGTPSIGEALRVSVAAGQDAAGVNIRYVPTSGARVYGYAFDSAGRPLTFPVVLIESGRSGIPLMSRREAIVRQDGAFAFLNVPPGDYVVQAVRRPAPGQESELAIEFVSVAGPDVPPVTIRTSRGTTLKGRVLFEGDTSKVQFDAFGVGVNPSDLDYAPIGLDGSGSGIGDDGTFELRAQGPFRIASRAMPPGWWLESAMIGVVNAADEPYTARGDAVDVLVVFSDAVAEIAGAVTDARGQAAQNTFVLLFPVDPSLWYLNSRFLKIARPGVGPPPDPRSAADGEFRLTGVPPGDYFIVAVEQFDVANEWQDAEVFAALAPLAQRLTVTERQRIVRDLRAVQRRRP